MANKRIGSLGLSRRLGEVVYLETAQGRISVKVMAIDRGKVKLSFKAPPAIIIKRKELVDGEPTDDDGADYGQEGEEL